MYIPSPWYGYYNRCVYTTQLNIEGDAYYENRTINNLSFILDIQLSSGFVFNTGTNIYIDGLLDSVKIGYTSLIWYCAWI